MRIRFAALSLAVCLCAGLTNADEKSLNPQIRKILDEVSEARIRATLEKLVSFGTRNTMSNPDDPVHGVGAARQWILNELKSYSPRLQVRFDKYRVKKQGQRVFKDVDLYNVIAVLPGTKSPEVQVWVSGHYDTLNLGTGRKGKRRVPAPRRSRRPQDSGPPSRPSLSSSRRRTRNCLPPAPVTMAAARPR